MNVCGWDKWQTYRKDRGTPPWIKVHRNLMTNPEWVSLDDAEKGQLVSIWLIAADRGGKIPDDPTVIQMMAMLRSTPDISKFVALGFLEDDGCQVVVKLASSGCHSDAPETEAETETETETDKPLVPSKKAPAKESYSELFESFWMAYPGNRRGNKKNAFREWKKIPDEQRLHLSSIVERRKLNDLDWRREKFKYVPHCERYLKGERWLDEWQVEQPQYSDVTANNIQTLKNWTPK